MGAPFLFSCFPRLFSSPCVCLLKLTERGGDSILHSVAFFRMFPMFLAAIFLFLCFTTIQISIES